MEPLKNPNSLENERNLLAIERTRLASERTFLSWIRTGLTGVGFGVAVARFVVFHSPEKELQAKFVGQLLIVWGIIVFIFSLVSYWRSYKNYKLDKDYKGILTGISLLITILIKRLHF